MHCKRKVLPNLHLESQNCTQSLFITSSAVHQGLVRQPAPLSVVIYPSYLATYPVISIFPPLFFSSIILYNCLFSHSRQSYRYFFCYKNPMFSASEWPWKTSRDVLVYTSYTTDKLPNLVVWIHHKPSHFLFSAILFFAIHSKKLSTPWCINYLLFLLYRRPFYRKWTAGS